jgi:hypothetical protein
MKQFDIEFYFLYILLYPVRFPDKTMERNNCHKIKKT